MCTCEIDATIPIHLSNYYHVARLQTLNEFYDTKVRVIEHLPPLTRKLIDDFVTNPLVVCSWLLFSCAC